ncbi:2186_t:CDS:1, partial [Ambispora gerdemannii]
YYIILPISQDIILDFRDIRKVQKYYPDTWYIIPTVDFKAFEIHGASDIPVVFDI